MSDQSWVFDDGGAEAAGYKSKAGDCVVRAAAIASGRPYEEVRGLVLELAKKERRPRLDPERIERLAEILPEERIRARARRFVRKGRGRRSTPRRGVFKPTIRRLMEALGGAWTPTMSIGSGCKVHLLAAELPSGRLAVSVSKHVVAVIDGVIRDTYDPSRGGTRCVYGYWTFPDLRDRKSTEKGAKRWTFPSDRPAPAATSR